MSAGLNGRQPVAPTGEVGMERQRKINGRLVLGGFLMLLGVVMLADQLGVVGVGPFWEYWPVLLIGFGAVRLIVPDEPDGRWGGAWLLLVGLYCGASAWHWFGLDWGTSWPLMVIAAGLMIVARALVGRGEERGKDAAGQGGGGVM